ncbi:MAG: OmpA family protein [Chitinophagaceae bacterium]|nr:OmpA family protein [Oligoflexus sp.]
MGTVSHTNKNRFIMAMFAMLAAPTNHSLGDVVYKKVSTLKVNPRDDEPGVVSTPNTPEPENSSFRVLKIQATGPSLTALIDGGLDRGMLPGTILRAQRPYISPLGVSEYIPVALLKTLEVRETYTLAEIVTNGSLDSQVHFPSYPELMLGDRAVPEAINIAARTQLLPTVSLSYKSLFVDPKSNPGSFELSAEGRQTLLTQAKSFAQVRAPILLVEAYTDTHGDRSANQMESYQRALTVRQTLIDELNIDPDRIIALGMGESETPQDADLPGGEDEARRVIIKVKTIPQGNLQ